MPTGNLLELPGYTDICVIGAESSGIVYRASQPRFDREVAVTLVLADLSGGDLPARQPRRNTGWRPAMAASSSSLASGPTPPKKRPVSAFHFLR